jgi:hypothetical protein
MWPVTCLRASIEPVIFFDARWMHGFKLTDNKFNGVSVNVNVRCEWHVSEVWFLSLAVYGYRSVQCFESLDLSIDIWR